MRPDNIGVLELRDVRALFDKVNSVKEVSGALGEARKIDPLYLLQVCGYTASIYQESVFWEMLQSEALSKVRYNFNTRDPEMQQLPRGDRIT